VIYVEVLLVKSLQQSLNTFVCTAA